MAEYKFETARIETIEPTLEVVYAETGFTDGNVSGLLSYSEEASGTLEITHLSAIEVEAIRRALFAQERQDVPLDMAGNGVIQGFIPELHSHTTRMEKVEEINEGRLTTTASLHRRGGLAVNTKGEFEPEEPRLDLPTITSFGAHLLMLGASIVQDSTRVEVGMLPDADPTPLELATVAETMHARILSIINPALLSVNELSIDMLQDRLSKHLDRKVKGILI